MKPISMIWTVLFYQPVGNFGHVYREYADLVCGRFLDLIEQHPQVRVNLYFSGTMLTHFAQEQPKIMEQLRRMLAVGQIELLGGSFYSSALNMFSMEDAERQLRLKSQWIDEHFGQRVRAAWLTESTWEPHYPFLLQQAGIEATVLEDSLFYRAGCTLARLFEPYRTESSGKSVVVLPYHRTWMREKLLKNPVEALSGLRQLSHRPDDQLLAVTQRGEFYFDAFPQKPISPNIENLEGWVNLLSENASWVNTQLITPYCEQPRLYPLMYLPNGCATDVQKRALPAAAQVEYEKALADLNKRFDRDRFTPFFHGGTWLGFISKYQEAHWMYKRLARLCSDLAGNQSIADWDDAMQWALSAQCNSHFWHGETGGLYANYLRDSFYQNLLRAENVFDQGTERPTVDIQRIDIDGDGLDEVILRAPQVQAIIRPAYGGSCCELDFLPSQFNLINTLKRTREAYHELPVFKDEKIIEDWHQRYLFQEHIVPAQTELSALAETTFIELGDFVDRPFRILSISSEQESSEVTLVRDGGIYWQNVARPLQLKKSIRLSRDGTLSIHYVLKNLTEIPTDFLFVVENNYTLLDGESPERAIHLHDKRYFGKDTFVHFDTQSCYIEDITRNLAWEWHFSPRGALGHYPVETLSMKNNAPEPSYQGSAALIMWPLQIPALQSAEYFITCRLGHRNSY